MSLADDARWCADNLDHSLTLTKADNAKALLRSCADKLDRLTAELASEKRVSDAGKAFRDLVVKERDYERIKNDRLTTELAAVRKDAERYRWLRYKTCGIRDKHGDQFELPKVPIPAGVNIMRGGISQHLDESIDAAIAEQEPNK